MPDETAGSLDAITADRHFTQPRFNGCEPILQPIIMSQPAAAQGSSSEQEDDDEASAAAARSIP
jgi:hypothetical protein